VRPWFNILSASSNTSAIANNADARDLALISFSLKAAPSYTILNVALLINYKIFVSLNLQYKTLLVKPNCGVLDYNKNKMKYYNKN
jgi:hypothetical protein